MKKFFALVVSLILILSLTACGGSDSSTDSAPDSGASSADPAAKTEIVYGKSQGPYTELFEAADLVRCEVVPAKLQMLVLRRVLHTAGTVQRLGRGTHRNDRRKKLCR